MGIFKIDQKKCDGSPSCSVARGCLVQAVEPVKVKPGNFFSAPLKYQIKQEACLGCGKCLAACPRKAVYQET